MQLVRLLAGFLVVGPGVALAPTALGVTNFQQVNDRIYRGGQPPDGAFQFIARLGIKTVIDLRAESGQVAAEEKLVSAAGMRFVNIPMDDLGAPTDSQIAHGARGPDRRRGRVRSSFTAAAAPTAPAP